MIVGTPPPTMKTNLTVSGTEWVLQTVHCVSVMWLSGLDWQLVQQIKIESNQTCGELLKPNLPVYNKL